MTAIEFREDRARCSHLSRILEMPTFKLAIDALLTDLSFRESNAVTNNPDATPNMELRMMNQRKGVTDFLVALKLLTDPLPDAPQEPLPDYGAGEEAAKLAGAETGWLPAVHLPGQG